MLASCYHGLPNDKKKEKMKSHFYTRMFIKHETIVDIVVIAMPFTDKAKTDKRIEKEFYEIHTWLVSQHSGPGKEMDQLLLSKQPHV
jgi:hypothetical protein